MLTVLGYLAGVLVTTFAVIGVAAVWLVVCDVIDDRRKYGGGR